MLENGPRSLPESGWARVRHRAAPGAPLLRRIRRPLRQPVDRPHPPARQPGPDPLPWPARRRAGAHCRHGRRRLASYGGTADGRRDALRRQATGGRSAVSHRQHPDRGRDRLDERGDRIAAWGTRSGEGAACGGFILSTTASPYEATLSAHPHQLHPARGERPALWRIRAPEVGAERLGRGRRRIDQACEDEI